MQTKAFEVRDKMTLIAVVGIQMAPPVISETGGHAWVEREQAAAERFLLWRAGFNIEDPPFSVLVCRLDADGNARQACSDAYNWGGRTLPIAHKYIEEHWGELKSGDVIDVEFLLGETKTKKTTERESHYP